MKDIASPVSSSRRDAVPDWNLTGTDLRAACYCAAEVIRSRQLHGQPVPGWLRKHLGRCEAALGAMARSRHTLPGLGSQSKETELIDAREAAMLLGCSKRTIHRLAADLDGEIVFGRWLFSRDAVTEYAERRRGA